MTSSACVCPPVGEWVHAAGASTAPSQLWHGPVTGGNAADWSAELQTGSTERYTHSSNSIPYYTLQRSRSNTIKDLRCACPAAWQHFHIVTPQVLEHMLTLQDTFLLCFPVPSIQVLTLKNTLYFTNVWRKQHPFPPVLSVAPGVAALALSGDWTSEFLSGADAAAAASSGQAGLGDPADADWTREFITDGTGTLFWNVNGRHNYQPFVWMYFVATTSNM
jgi:hypothetical protein